MSEEIEAGRIEAVAKALYEQAVTSATLAVGSIPIDCTRFDAVTKKLKNETDRGCAVLLYSVFDDMMRDLILARCETTIPSIENRMFGQFGLLPTSSSRLLLMYALKWMSRQTFHNVNVIRKIRNEFAHSINCDRFDHPKIKDLLSSLQPIHREHLGAALDIASEFTDERGKAMFCKDKAQAIYDLKERIFFDGRYVSHTRHGYRNLCTSGGR